MVDAEAYLPIIFAVVFEVCFQTVMSINNYNTLTAFGTEWPIRDKSWYFYDQLAMYYLSPLADKAGWKSSLDFKGPIGAINCELWRAWF